MQIHRLDGYSNLFLFEEAKKFFDEVDNSTLDKMLSKLLYFNEYGANSEYFKSNFLKGDRYKKIIEIKGKTSSKREWRILAIKISKGKQPAEYVLLHAFFKKTPEITKKDKELARRIAVSLGILGD